MDVPEVLLYNIMYMGCNLVVLLAFKIGKDV